jgi:hypothetical protein
MTRKILIALAWVASGIAGLCILLYLAVVAINWRDAEPSAEALRMLDSYRDRPAVRDEDNAFIFIMGFGVAPGESPLEMGRERVAWLQQYEGPAELYPSTDPLGDPPNHRAGMHPALLEYFQACGPGASGCAAALAEASRTFNDWRASQDWLLDRYEALLELPGWLEEISGDAAAPLPTYQVVMDGQKVLLLHARSRATHGDASGVRELLGEDLRFWRGVLASSDLLITKMVATSAINRHFKLGTEAIGLLPPEQAFEAVPAEWRVEITEAERSMRRIMIGEWLFSSSMIRELDRELLDGLPAQDSLVATLSVKLGGPFFQLQDTINQLAAYYSLTADLIDGVPLSGYEAGANQLTEMAAEATSEAWPPRSLYNITGRMLVGFGADYGSYARRLGDIEGVRRAALAAVELRAAKVKQDDVPAALAASSLRNPYDGEPFIWDATDGAIVFRGLEPGERGEHRIY